MHSEAFVSLVIHDFEHLKELADRAIAQMPPETLFSKPGESDNSIAVIVKHISGNLISRWTDFLTSDGEKAGRGRDDEFVILAEDTAVSIFARWEKGWSILFSTLETLSSVDLNRSVIIRSEQLTILQAIQRQLLHYAYHVGQIVYLAKHYTGSNWSSLTIPLGQSENFNQSIKTKSR